MPIVALLLHHKIMVERIHQLNIDLLLIGYELLPARYRQLVNRIEIVVLLVCYQSGNYGYVHSIDSIV